MFNMFDDFHKTDWHMSEWRSTSAESIQHRGMYTDKQTIKAESDC